MRTCNVTTIFSGILVGVVRGKTDEECQADYDRALAAGEFRLPDGTQITPEMEASSTPLWWDDNSFYRGKHDEEN